MTKKTISKVIAAVLVASLCLAAVFTGSVSAATASCSVTGYKYNPGTVGSGTDYVLYEVKFTASNADAFTAGSFTIDAPGLTFVDCVAKTSNTGEVPNVYLNVSNNKVLFAGFSESATNDFQSFTSLTLVLKFSPATAVAGTVWNVTINNISITNTAEATYNCDSATGKAHVHNYGAWSTSGNIKTRTCQVAGCGAEDKQVVSTGGVSSNTFADTIYANLSFTADGDTVLNALVPKSVMDAKGGTTYFAYKYKDDDAGIKTATSTSTGTITLTGTNAGTYYVFPCGKNGGIGRMSRPIEGNFINDKSGTITVSALWSKSIKDYLADLISVGTTAQKNYAKALWNYGYYTTKYLKETKGEFTDDFNSYNNDVKSLANWGLPAEYTAVQSGSVGVTGIDVKTGFKPTLKVKLSSAGSVTVSAYTTTGHDTLIYKKTIEATAGTYFDISDIPTKYLTGDIVIEKGGNSFTYSFGRYAKRLAVKNATATNTYAAQWMMNYSYYLGQAFA